MNPLDALVAKMAAENNAEEAKRSKGYKPADAVSEVAFLQGWAKGKPIVRQGSEGTFWACGKWMHKLDFGLVELIVKNHPECTLRGDPKQRGATLIVPKAEKKKAKTG